MSATSTDVVIENAAEILDAVALLKIVAERCPLMLAGTTGLMDMASGSFSTGVPEIALMNVAQIKLIHSCGAPAMSVGYATDSHGFSHKAGAESMGVGIITRLAKPDMMLGPGNMEAGSAFSLPKLVFDGELLAYTGRLLRGMAVDAQHAEVAAICEVGPGGNFLEHEDTVAFLRAGEHWRSRLMRATTWCEWESSVLTEDGSVCEVAQAKAKVDEILATHRPLPLPAGAEETIVELLAAVPH